jgi:hypothetical protein
MNPLAYLAAAVAVVAVFCWLVAHYTDDTITIEPDEHVQFDKCDTTGCPYAGWVPVTRRDTREVVEVCAGCHQNGELRGWWAA